jgi:hypothetical protein
MSLSGLAISVTIGSTRILRVPSCTVSYDRESVLSRAFISVPDPAGDFIRLIEKGQSVTISMGYRGKAAHEWSGTVDGWLPSQGNNPHQWTVAAVGPELALVKTRITAMYMDEDVAWIARRILAETGLPIGTIEAPQITIPRMTLSNVPAWRGLEQLAHSVERANGVDMSAHAVWLDEAGAVHWGTHNDIQDETPIISTGAGLLNHHLTKMPYARQPIETYLLPVMRAGRCFRIVDSRRGVDETPRALRVEHKVTPKSARTFLSYGEEYGRF